MANTVPILSYTNTFGDLLSQQNKAAVELNNLGANTYTKDAGTLILNGTGTGLSVSAAASLGSGIVANTFSVGGDITALSNVFLNGAGTTLVVSNNANILRTTQANTLAANTITGVSATLNLTPTIVNFTGTTLNANSATGNFSVLNVSGNTSVDGILSAASDVFLTGPNTALTISNNAVIFGNTSLNNISANVIRGFGSTLTLSPNTITITSTTLNANSATGNFNELSTVGDIRVSGASVTNNLLVANQGTINSLQANTTVNTRTLSVTGTSFTNILQANSSVNTAVLSVTGNTFTNFLTVNTSIIVPNMTLSGTTLNATGATGNFQSLTTTGAVTVGGNFAITGQTVYATNTFTLSAGVGSPITSFYNVFRPAAANASFRWNETSKYWDMNNVTTSIFYRVLTDEFRSDVTTIGGSTNIATSNAVFYLQGLANTTNTNIAVIQGVDTTQNTRLNAIETINTNQNTSITIIQGVDTTQNTRLNAIETINTNQNTSISIIQGVDTTQNTQIAGIQGVDLAQNAAITIIQGVDATQNTTITQVNQFAASAYAHANNAYNYANTQVSIISGIDATQNTRLNSIETINTNQNTTITQVNQFAGGAYATANGANGLAAGAYNTANNRVATVGGTAGRITSTGTTAITLDLDTAGPGATSATNASLTIDVYGRVTALSSGTAPVTSITGTTNQITVTGTTTPTLSLPQSINTGASVQFGSFGVGTAASGTAGEIRATNNITAYFSDERLKTRLGNIENALDKVMSLNGFYHEANETAQALGYQVVREVGVSAQEVERVLPEVVAPAPIDPQYLTVRYERMVPLLIEAVKELKKEIDELKKVLNN